MTLTYEIAPNRLTTKEILDPRRTPEAGFQSYEYLVNDAVNQKAAFIAGEMRNPELHYPMFYRTSALDVAIENLDYAKQQIRDQETPEMYGYIAPSLTFRQAEMSYVKSLALLDYHVKNGDQEKARLLTEHLREVNEVLYGAPDAHIASAAYNKLWSMIDGKELHPTAQILRDELENGFVFQGVPVAPLTKAEDPEARLPEYQDNDALEWFSEIVLEANADIHKLVEHWWETKVVEHGEAYVAGPQDIAEIFEEVVKLRDPGGESGVSVKLLPGKTALSWESPELSIHVGENRVPIRSESELFAIILHEFGKHGQACINGLKSHIPVLGTGLYTETARPDYLTAEEGIATTAQAAVGDVAPKWTVAMLGHYINISEAARNGHDFRETFEKSWRYRLLATVKSGQEVTEDMIARHQSAAYTATVRIFRGTPLSIKDTVPGVKPLTFNKDLAYLNGRVLALDYIAECYKSQDVQAILRLFRGKYDPTIPEQLAIAKRGLDGSA